MAQNWKSGLNRFAEWFSRLAAINLLWILFTVAGLVLLGFIPATVSMFAVTRWWLRGEITPDETVFNLFWKTYKQEFLRSNAVASVLLVIGYILYIDLFVFEFPDTGLMQSIQFIIYLLSLYFLMAVSFFFPVYVTFSLKGRQSLKMMFLMPFVLPFRGFAMLILGYAVIFFMGMMPILYVFFAGSTIAYIWLLVTLPAFAKLRQRYVKEESD